MMDVNYETVLERRVTREGFSRLADDSQRKLRQLISPSAADVTPPQQAGDAAPTSTTAVSETQEPPNAGGGFRLPNWLAPSRSYLKSREAPTPVPGDGKQLPEVHDPRAQTPAPTPAEAPAATASSGADRGFARARQRKKDEETTAASPPQAAPSKLSDLMTSLPKEAQNAAGAGLHLDPWQAEALDALMAGSHLVVDAPTSAGKTRVIEALLEKRMKEGMKLIYTTPVKSLSNDKYREFCEKYGKERVGINTGDFKENLGAPIILATLETYRNSLLGVEPNMARRVVVYDEYHYLQDESRGSAWEESIILTPKHSQLVLLSASVPNADEFADWITSLTGKECKVIRVQKRPVPLVDLVWTRHGWVFADDLKLSPEETRELGRRLKTAQAGVRRYLKAKLTHQEVLEPVAAALALNLGPIVVYAGRRSDVEAIAHAIARHLRMEYSGPEAEKMRNRINNLPGWDYVPHELQRLVKRYGIAYHHSGMIPPGRVAIETLLKEGLLRVCTGTMGISLGVNFAVRSALVADESRPSESGETRYSGTEVMQMLGRAGRRGHDKQGFSLWVNLGRYALQKPTGREPTRSSLKFDPTTVLGILGQHENFAFLSDFYKKSFFMRGKDETQVLIEDHDLIGSLLYRNQHRTRPL